MLSILLVILAYTLITYVLAHCALWGYNIRFTMPGGLVHALCDPETYRGADNVAIIPSSRVNEHHDAVTVKRWGIVVWNSVNDRSLYITDPTRAYTIIPRGTKAYRLIRTLVERAPVAAKVRAECVDWNWSGEDSWRK